MKMSLEDFKNKSVYFFSKLNKGKRLKSWKVGDIFRPKNKNDESIGIGKTCKITHITNHSITFEEIKRR